MTGDDGFRVFLDVAAARARRVDADDARARAAASMIDLEAGRPTTCGSNTSRTFATPRSAWTGGSRARRSRSRRR